MFANNGDCKKKMVFVNNIKLRPYAKVMVSGKFTFACVTGHSVNI